MNELQIFNNEEFGEIRTVMIDGDPWFVGKDVAVALGYAEPRSAVSKKIDEEDKGVAEMETPSGRQQMTIINESGVYSLIFGSKLESAKRFKHWVTSEVLPTLRKNGTYTMKAKQRDLTKDDYLRAASIVAGCRNERMPYVLSFLEQGGFRIPEIEQAIPEQDSDVDINLIVKLKEDKGISLAKLSEMTNICKSSLSYYLRGIHALPLERYEVIIAALQ